MAPPSAEATGPRSPTLDPYAGIAAWFDRFASQEDVWLRRTGPYHDLVGSLSQALVAPGQRVLEIGCGRGDLLAGLKPSYGLGIDVSPGMVEAARARHPELEFACLAGESLEEGDPFDVIVMSDLVAYVEDLQALFEAVGRRAHPGTRVVVSTYSNLWRPLLAILTALRLRPSRPVRNWVAPRDLENLAALADLEVVTDRKEILAPVRSRVLSRVLNGFAARLPGVRGLTLTYWMVARFRTAEPRARKVSVIVPCRNEAGTVRDIVDRIPEMGAATEIVFVEGGSTDDTRERIEREIGQPGARAMRLLTQSGKGKWNAVQEGFDAAEGDILMILDADLTVAPEDLPKFHAALEEGRGEFVNGSRLVYGMEPGAMRFLNMLGNKFFAAALSLVLGQYVKDSLCGTKAIFKADWARLKLRRRELEAEDLFGDFDLLLGAALLGLKIVNVPVRYGARVYGETNMRRFSYGLLLLRLTVAGYQRIWVRALERGPR